MKKIDTITKEYISQNIVVADIFNKLNEWRFPLIKAENLRELDSTVSISSGLFSKEDKQTHQDMVRIITEKTDGEKIFAIFQIENQTNVDYSMPVRCMQYDSMRYSNIINHIDKANKRSKRHRDVFTSPLNKGDKISPVLSVVLYWGSKPWDGPRTLHEMLAVDNQELLELIPDYEINILDASCFDTSHTKGMESTLPLVMNCLRFSRDKHQFHDYLQNESAFKKLDPLSANLISAITKIKLNIDENEKEVDMCKAINDLIKDGIKEKREEWRAEGRAEGRVEGRAEERLANISKFVEIFKKQGYKILQIREMLINEFNMTEAEAKAYL